LPELKNKYRPSLVIANGENAAGGIGLTEEIARELLLQVDVLTSGNHIWDKKRFQLSGERAATYSASQLSGRKSWPWLSSF